MIPYFQASLASVNPVPVSEFLFGGEFRFTPLASRVLLSHWALMQVIARHQLSFRATRCRDLSVGLNPKGDSLWEELANTATAFPTEQGGSHIGPVAELMAST